MSKTTEPRIGTCRWCKQRVGLLPPDGRTENHVALAGPKLLCDGSRQPPLNYESELLAALKIALPALERAQVEGGGTGYYQCAADQVRAAIALVEGTPAEGRTPC